MIGEDYTHDVRAQIGEHHGRPESEKAEQHAYELEAGRHNVHYLQFAVDLTHSSRELLIADIFPQIVRKNCAEATAQAISASGNSVPRPLKENNNLHCSKNVKFKLSSNRHNFRGSGP